jgi:hypothetical protein
MPPSRIITTSAPDQSRVVIVDFAPKQIGGTDEHH